MVERLSPKYVHRYINTETNEHYEDFVRDEQVVQRRTGSKAGSKAQVVTPTGSKVQVK